MGLASGPAFAANSQTDQATQARGECQPEQDDAYYKAKAVRKKKQALAEARMRVRAATKALDEADTPREVRIAKRNLTAAEEARVAAKSALARARARSEAANQTLEACLAGGGSMRG